jgi:hypothetical protein
MARGKKQARAQQLSEQLKALGAGNPEQLALEEVQSGAPHLSRYRFVKKAWSFVAEPGDSNWIDASIAFAEQHPAEPGAQAGRALKQMRDKGVSDAAITELVRYMQHHVLHGVCYLLDHAADVEPNVEGPEWALCALDEDGSPVEHMGGLYEITAELDPTGRALAPEVPTKKAAKS